MAMFSIKATVRAMPNIIVSELDSIGGFGLAPTNNIYPGSMLDCQP